ncbi:MAG: hypothetical protein ACW98Y_20325 [Candidatus Thorarchaeota archaeon]
MVEKGSRISRRLKKTGDLLLGGAQKQVEGYKSKFENLVGTYDKFMYKVILSYEDKFTDPKFIDTFFGKRDLTFAGIDGTICKQDVFDLLIFFAGAYSSNGIVCVDENGKLDITYDEKYLERGIGVSSVLPIYINEVPDVDQTILVRDEVGEIDHTVTFSDSWIIDNSAFADYLMGLAEFYLGYKLTNSENPVDILLLDRICSSEISSYYAETSDFRINLEKDCGIIGYEIEGRPFATTEWIYARRLFGNLTLGTPPPRGEYLLARVISELIDESSGLTRKEIVSRLDLDNEIRIARLDKELESGMKGKDTSEGIITRKGDRFFVKPEYKTLKKRVRYLVDEVCERMFSENPNISFDDRFKINGRWITTNDLAFLSLASLFLMVEASWKNRTLLVGVAKDTAARDLKRQLLPVLNHIGVFKGGFDVEGQEAPDTDRMILQWISLQERQKLSVPWATSEYDTAFKTAVPHLERKKGLVSGARRNQISLEKTFVKSYFQLCQAQSDEKLRSNVLLYDRLVYPEIDIDDDTIVTLNHDYAHSPLYPEPVEVIFWQEKENPIQQFIIDLFRKMTSMSIPELFGHIKPLYIADKVAKYHFQHFKSMVDSAGMWLVNRPELRELIFYLSTFRERRETVEQTRRFS